MILFAQVPDFYVEVERLRLPELRGRAVLVGGDPSKRGLVQAASSQARAAGVAVGMSMREAAERCPDVRVVKTDMKHYREVSRRLQACLRAELGQLESAALEAGYADLSTVSGGASTVEDLGVALIERVRDAFDLPLRVGAATSKFLAVLAAEEAPPGSMNRVEPGEEQAFLAPLAVGRLPGVGPKTQERLERLGAATVGDLLKLDPDRLEVELGNHGLRILSLAAGSDSSVVRGHHHPRSLSREQTFEVSQLDLGEMWDCLQRLSVLLAEGLAQQELCGRCVIVKLRFDDQQLTTRSQTFQTPVQSASDILAASQALLERTQAGTRPLRMLGLSVAGLGPRPETTQLELFGSRSPHG